MKQPASFRRHYYQMAVGAAVASLITAVVAHLAITTDGSLNAVLDPLIFAVPLTALVALGILRWGRRHTHRVTDLIEDLEDTERDMWMASPNVMLVTNHCHEIEWANDAACRLLRCSQPALRGRRIDSVLRPMSSLIPQLEAIPAGRGFGSRMPTAEMTVTLDDGDPVHLLVDGYRKRVVNLDDVPRAGSRVFFGPPTSRNRSIGPIRRCRHRRICKPSIWTQTSRLARLSTTPWSRSFRSMSMASSGCLIRRPNECLGGRRLTSKVNRFRC